jgi:hypothetical protein
MGAIWLMGAALAAGCATSDNRMVVGEAKPMLGAPKTMTAAEVAELGESTAAASVESAAAPASESASESASGSASGSGEADGARPVDADQPATAVADGKRPIGKDKSPSTDPASQSVTWPRGVDATLDDIANYAIGSVSGRVIPLSDLVAKWIWREPTRVRAILDDLVLSHIIVFEAAALQIELPDGAIKKAVETRLATLEREAASSGAASLEAYIQEALGMEPETYLKYAQEEAAIDLLAPRCVRAWMLTSDHREIRAITVKSQADVDQVQARLAKGEPFADVARALSVDPSKEDGGRLPPVVRGSDLVLTRTAFAAEVGDVAGPIKDRDGMLFVYVESAPKPLEGLWQTIGAEVEASLAARDIEDPEFWQWKAQMLGRYDVNMEPFLNLVK